MAEDVITLLDYVGWTDDIHVVGLSLGGMIAQGNFLGDCTIHMLIQIISELATRICRRIVSLILCVTKPGGLSWRGLTPVRSSSYA